MDEPLVGPYHLMTDIPGRRMVLYSEDGWRIATGGTGPLSGSPGTLQATLQLLAASWELREALTAIEWGRHGIVRGEVEPICACCDAAQADGHLPGCTVGTALRKARGQVVGGP